MLVDIIICLFFLSVLARGGEIGLIRQFSSTAGFFAGLLIGAKLVDPHIVSFAHTQLSRSLLTLTGTVGTAILLLSVGEYIGAVLKSRVQIHKINIADKLLGSIAGGLTLLITVWLAAPVLVSLPFPTVQTSVRSSLIVNYLNIYLPPAPNIIADLSHIIDPNGFPEVFRGLEPTPPANTTLPDLGSLQTAVSNDRTSVVKVEGTGCGGIVEGSGFIADNGVVITNAHVIAGVSNPYIIDNNGSHKATTIWLDPNLDLAVLTTSNLAGKPLNIATRHVNPGEGGAILGYPSGGAFNAQPASVLEEFNATGQNIYAQGSTTRDIYEIEATIIPGNSGGPLVSKDGSVIGVVFAESTTYNQVGYALTTKAVIAGLQQAEARNTPVAVGSCAE